MAIASKKKRPSKSLHHQRRHGLHQKRNEHFVKTYWPYLPLMLVVVVGLAVNSLWTSHANHSVLGIASDMSIGELLNGTNSQRAGNGEASLSLNGELDQAAQTKAQDMVNRDYWSHNTPDGTPPWTFISNAGYSFSTAGENLAYGFDTSDATITGWMNSSEHRANILNSSFVDVGFGIANSDNFQGSGPQTIVVAEYAAPLAAAPNPTPKPATPVTTTPKAATPTPVAATPAPATPAPAPTPTPAVTNPTTAKASTTAAAASKTVAEPASQKVSRIQIVTAGSAPWSLFVASTLMSAGLLMFVIKHGLGLRRALLQGETFIVKHQLLDFVLIIITVAGFVLTRTTGFIR